MASAPGQTHYWVVEIGYGEHGEDEETFATLALALEWVSERDLGEQVSFITIQKRTL